MLRVVLKKYYNGAWRSPVAHLLWERLQQRRWALVSADE